MIKLCIFDLDGTLTDTIPAISHFGNTALEKFSFGAIDADKYKILVGNGRDLLIHRMLQEHGADTQENFEKVGAEYDKDYEADPLYKTAPYDGIIDLLAKLKERGIKLAVLSNKPHNVANDVVKLFFGDTFHIVYGQREGVNIKPDPAAAIEIAENFGVDASETLFIGDTNVDIKTGKNANMTAVGVLWGFRGRPELEEAGADFIVARPEEILNIF